MSMTSRILICIITYYIISIFLIIKLITKRNANKKTLNIKYIILTAAMFTLYNVIITKLSIKYGIDRTSYLNNFEGLSQTPSFGLSVIIDIIKIFSNNVELLFYFTSFVSIIITYISIAKSKDYKISAIIFLLSTQFIFISFVNLKQIYAIALGSIAITLAIENANNKERILSIILALISILFHPTGIIVVPIILLVLSSNKKNTLLLIMLTILLVLFFQPILTQLASISSHIIPSVSNKITQYINEMNMENGGNSLYNIVIRGLPFYIVTICALISRKGLSKTIKNYDKYLIISVICSFIILLSIYNTWITRLSFYLYAPISILYSILLSNSSKRSLVKFMLISSIVLLNITLVRYIALIMVNYKGF